MTPALGLLPPSFPLRGFVLRGKRDQEDRMGTAFGIIAIAGLMILLVISTQRWRAERTANAEAVARSHTGEAEAQAARSARARADVRAAHAERARTVASDDRS
jgi:hypothetical protein